MLNVNLNAHVCHIATEVNYQSQYTVFSNTVDFRAYVYCDHVAN